MPDAQDIERLEPIFQGKIHDRANDESRLVIADARVVGTEQAPILPIRA